MKLLITGGAGFMGSNFIRYLLQKYPDYQIINLDKLTYAGNLENLKDLEGNPRYSFFRGDIAEKKDVALALGEEGVDAIINYAAETHVDRSILDPEAFIKTDVLGTYQLLEAVRLGHAKKLIQISTDEVFGETDTEFVEDSPFLPNSPYSASKAGGDLMCRAYFRTYKTPVVVTHSCNFYGPNQYPEKLISLSITNLLENKPVPLYGEGENVREWIFTQDHCRAVDAILHQGKSGEVYNIGTGERKTNKEVLDSIFKILGANKSLIQKVKDRPGHDVRYAVDSSKLRQELDWQPETNFSSGIKETIHWYQKNEAWWKRLKDDSYREYYKKQYGS
jgi:dTDP-glucose 4,6-dehydratase